MPDLPPGRQPFYLLLEVSRERPSPHLCTMVVVTCDLMSGPGTGEGPLRQCVPACLLPLLAGCCAAGVPAEVHHPPACPEQRAVLLTPVPAWEGVVFVANGSGDYRSVSTNLSQVMAETATPLQVETALWSHGRWRYLADHLDHANHLNQGRQLAAQVVAYRQACPGRRVYLVGHSTGCAVVLAAAEGLPVDSIDRVVLLAPSVCVSYDLRPAPRSARAGIDVFYSGEDRAILGLGMGIVGTAEGGCRSAAGLRGFSPVIASTADAALYEKLHQHPWSPAFAWRGHDGGHYGSTQPEFLRAYVLPLLRSS
jgi:pimeloyl-ACP methyl ester carboxylesterase